MISAVSLLLCSLFVLSGCRPEVANNKRSYTDVTNTDEKERWQFRYDHIMHQIVMDERFDHQSNCYVYNLNDVERQQVHTKDGMMQIELQLLQMVKHVHSVTSNINGTAPGNQGFCRTKNGYKVVYLN